MELWACPPALPQGCPILPLHQPHLSLDHSWGHLCVQIPAQQLANDVTWSMSPARSNTAFQPTGLSFLPGWSRCLAASGTDWKIMQITCNQVSPNHQLYWYFSEVDPEIHTSFSDIAESFKDPEKNKWNNAKPLLFYPFHVPPSSAQHLWM